MSTTALAPAPTGPPAPANHPGPDLAAIERVVMAGDLSRLTADERMLYIHQLCQLLSLNPLTQPFIYLAQKGGGGKLAIYPTKDCAAQLRRVHDVSLTVVSTQITDDLVSVCVRATMPARKGGHKRADDDTGAISVKGLSGEDKANAIMKATTKAKRRATLSICGLGFLDPDETVERQMNMQAPAPGIAAPPPRPALPSPATTPENLTVDLPANAKATPEQIEELSRLKSELKIETQAWRGQILARRGVSSARDLTPGQAFELIEKLRHRLAVGSLEAGKDDPQALAVAQAAREAASHETATAGTENGAPAAPATFPGRQ